VSMEKKTLLQNVGKYAGEWVVICENKIIAHGTNLLKMKADISSCKRTPTIAKIPKSDALIF